MLSMENGNFYGERSKLNNANISPRVGTEEYIDTASFWKKKKPNYTLLLIV